MSDYKVYYLQFPCGMIYVGSTHQTFVGRMDAGYNSMVKVLWAVYPQVKHTLIEVCNSKKEMLIREQFWLDHYRADPSKTILNMMNAYLTSEQKANYLYEYRARPEVKEAKKTYNQEYNTTNREEILAKKREYSARPEVKAARVGYDKVYYSENREAILKQKKEYSSRPEVKEAKKEYNTIYAETHKEEIKKQKKKYSARPKVKEAISKNKKEYYKANKDKILEKKYSRINCSNCGKDIAYGKKARHMKTIACMNFNK